MQILNIGVKPYRNNCFLYMYLYTVQATPGLILPAEREIGLGCIPEGMTVSYECTVTDPTDSPVANTVWLGTAFNCHSAASATTNNRITLAHSQFQLGAVAGDCGDLSAMIIRFIGNEYTSRLVLTNTTGLNGMTVICTLSDKAAGNDTVKIGGEYNYMYIYLTVSNF